MLLWLVTLTTLAQEDSPQGCRRGTPRLESRHLRRSSGLVRTPGGDFYRGDRHQLTILVAFNDRSFLGDEAATLAQWDMMFNTENLQDNPFKGSVHDYFLSQSYGAFNVTFDLEYVLVSGNAAKYASTQSDDENSQYLVEDIIEVLQTRDIDWSQYDWNGDGYINQLLIIYAGKGMNDGGGSNSIWPHQWWMSEHLKDRQQGVYCDPIPVNVGSKQYLVDCYCALAELTGKNDYGSFGTICHEYSHCFGLPDIYYGSSTSVVGGWDLMDRGNSNGDGYCPPGYSAHERWLMGWLTPIELTEATTVTDMPELSENPVAYFVRNDAWPDEYYFIENRQQEGWDAATPGRGVVVFHIDYDPTIWTSTTVRPNSSSYKRYSIFAANYRSSYIYSYNWPYPYVSNNQLTNESTPAATLNHVNTDGSKLMGKPLTNIAVTDGLASFDFLGGTTAIHEAGKRQGRVGGTVLYRVGPIHIIRYPDGTITKVMSNH